MLQDEFRKSKEEIINRVKEGVKTYDIKKLTCVSSDWSKSGIGMLVSQKYCECALTMAPRCCKEGFKIVFAGSKRCSGAESRYAPIEGEALGVVWSLDKARMFTLGCPNLLVTVDHEPLVPILGNKDMADIANPRLYRFKERTLRYNFKIQYLPGDQNDTPDCMSRVHENMEEDENNEVRDDEVWSDNEVGAVISACYIADVEEVVINRCQEDDMAVTMEEIARLGKEDKEYTVFKKAVLDGFPEKLEDCVPLIQPYHKNKHNITVVVEDNNEVLVYFDSASRSRLIIPKALRN